MFLFSLSVGLYGGMSLPFGALLRLSQGDTALELLTVPVEVWPFCLQWILPCVLIGGGRDRVTNLQSAVTGGRAPFASWRQNSRGGTEP